jgi:hypothetical protein
MEELERAVMARFLKANTPVAAELRAQYAAATVVRRELTGVGFFIDYSVAVDAPRIVPPNLEIGDAATLTNGIGVGFVLFVRDGAISMLEGYTYDEPWPDDARIKEWEESPG